MRLLEPLNGIKMGQGHYIIHFYFAVAMFLIPTDLNIDMSMWLPKEVAKSAEEKHKHDEAVEKEKKEKEAEVKELMSMMDEDYEAPGYWQPSFNTGYDEMKEMFSQQLTHLSNVDKHVMNSHDIHALTPKEIKQYELGVFYTTRVYHIASFILILLIIELKRLGWFVFGQGL